MWPNTYTTDGRPKSILISVLMVEAYRKRSHDGAQYVEVEFKKLVKNHRSLW